MQSAGTRTGSCWAMSLDVRSLKEGLMETARSHPKSPAEAAQRYALAYSRYASDATSPAGGSVVSVAAAQELLEASLVPAFSAFDANISAQLQTASFTAFWLLPPIVFTGTTPGLVTLTPGSLLLPSALLSVWAANVATSADYDQAIGRIADILHSFTLTVIVAHAAPVSIVGLIS